MIRFFAEHPTAANILMFALVLIGLVALPSLNKETFPKIAFNKVSVTVAYPGASPGEVEEGICNRLEDATDGLSYVVDQRCEARDNVGVLTLEMQEGGDIKQFIDDINAAVDSITDFPDNAEAPVVEELGRTDPVVSVAINANISQPELKALAEHYRGLLLALPEVPIVTVSGFSIHELSVLVSAETLRQYQLSIQDIANLIGEQSLDLPAGTVETEDRDYQLRFENQRRTVDELLDLVILNNAKGGQIRLGDIATVVNDFIDEEQRVEFNGKPAALLNISKNANDDSLTIMHAVKAFVERENALLPDSTRLVITRDFASIVQERLSLLTRNGWQGLVLAALALFVFFSWRYTFWVALGLPISFIGGLALMSVLGVSINMISMVALLMAIGILMDDAIVISESIEAEHSKGKEPLQAAIDGVQKVARGVFSSFLTSALLFGSLLFLEGDMGQVMRVLPIVLLSVISVSLIEAFLILPHHLQHSLSQRGHRGDSPIRLKIEAAFELLRARVVNAGELTIRYRYIFLGVVIGLFVLTLSLIGSGIVKFKAFPDLEGNNLDARIIMPQGTPFGRTEIVVGQFLESLDEALQKLPAEKEGAKLIKNIQIQFGSNADAGEVGEHLATISLDLLDTETREASIAQLRRAWFDALPAISDAASIQIKEPSMGPAGKAISIQLQGEDLQRLSDASWRLQTWLQGYSGVSNLLDDLRPGKPQLIVSLQPGYLESGVDAQLLSSQLRAAYQGIKVSDIYADQEAYEINVRLQSEPRAALGEFENLLIFNRQGEGIPLTAIAKIEEQREFSRILRVNHQRTVTISGDVDSAVANTHEVISHTQEHFMPALLKEFPDLSFSLEGEVKNSRETNSSVGRGFMLGILGVYLLLCLQFRNYGEPLIVLLNIPLGLIGVIWGHLLMGLDITMPSMIGLVSLSGIVVNDSILLVEFVKRHIEDGKTLHDAASQAVSDRFRAIFLTSVTTIAGMLPLLFESSLQAQVLIPLVTSVVFGMLTSTVLILFVLPAVYAVVDDFGVLSIEQ